MLSLYFLSLFASSLAAPIIQRFSSSSHSTALPVVIWHGLGDSASNDGLQELAHDLTSALNSTVYLIHFAEGSGDQKASFFGKAADQVASAAEQIAALPELKDGYNAVGLSQGGQLLRALVQQYPEPRCKNLITLGSQHMGVSELPTCKSGDWFCRAAEVALRAGVWTNYAQSNVIPAQYFRNQQDIGVYLLNSGWLREMNNERWGDEQVGGSEDYLKKNKDGGEGDRSPRNETFKENLAKLENFVMLSFSEDTVVVPYTSPSFTLLNYTSEIPTPIKLQDLPIYKADYIGLKQLDERKALHYGSCKGGHMQIDKECWNQVINWLRPAVAPVPFVMQGHWL